MRKALLPLLSVAALFLTATPAASSSGTNVRFATFNASLNRAHAGQLLADLSTPDNAQAREAAEVIQRNRPDVLLVNEFDYVPGNAAANAFRTNYLQRGQNGARPIDFPYAYTAPSNTGVQTGYDLDRDGKVGGGGDAHGFGDFEGQYGMLVLSKYPIDIAGVRTFQHFRWKDMPGAMLPDDPATPALHDWYSEPELTDLRLSSKSHWDLPLRIGGGTVHFLVSHPTPPSFDGPEDRNGTRNHDEIRFMADYVTPGKGGYIYDDAGKRGGLPASERFVVAGTTTPTRSTATACPARSTSSACRRGCSTRIPAASAAWWRAVSKAGRTRHTGRTRSSTPVTSTTRRPATCAPTTCCPRAA